MTSRFQRKLAIIATVMLVSACATSPPERTDNVCDIFREKSGWYADAKESRARWGVPISVSMAFMHQESRFVATAKPPRKKLWVSFPALAPPILMVIRRPKTAPGNGTNAAQEITVQTVMTLATPLILSAGTTTSPMNNWVSTSRTPFVCILPTMRAMAGTASKVTAARNGWWMSRARLTGKQIVITANCRTAPKNWSHEDGLTGGDATGCGLSQNCHRTDI